VPVSGIFTPSGTQTVSGTVALGVSLPSGTNNIGTVTTTGTVTVGNTILPISVISGALTSISNTVTVSVGGSVLADASANAAAVPINGYVLLSTLAASSVRGEIECQNQDTSYVQLVLDDGSGTAGKISTVMLAPAAATGQQGGSWVSQSFKGRARAYGPSSTQRVMLRGG
jgi:hypothetical protein